MPENTDTKNTLFDKLGLPEDLGEMDYRIQLEHIKYGDENDIDLDKKKLLKETALSFLEKVVENSEDPVKYYGKGYKDFIEHDEIADTITPDIKEIINQIDNYFTKHGIPNDDFVAKFKSIKKEIDDVKNIPDSQRAVDANSIQNTRLVGWLLEQVHVLALYDKEKYLHDQKDAQLKQKQSVKDGNVDIRALDLDPSSSEIYNLQNDVAKSEIGLKSIKSALLDLTQNEKYDKSKLEPVTNLRDKDFIKAASFFAETKMNPVVHKLMNPIFAGLMTSTKAKETALYGKLIADEKEKIPAIFKKFGIDIQSGKVDMKSIQVDLEAQKQSGVLTDQEYKDLMAFYQRLADKDKDKEKFIDELQTKINALNEDIEEKIKKAEVTDDDLNKLRIIQVALLLSPFFGISLVPIAVNAFLPFFQGQEMADWVASFLSADGPLSWTGIPQVAEWMRLDDATAEFLHLFDGISAFPETILTGENNPISILARNVGGGLANSPFGNWILAAIVNKYSGYLERESKLGKDKDAIRTGAKKGLEKMLTDMEAAGKKSGLDKKTDIVKYRTELAVASKMSVWLQNKNLENEVVCREFVEKTFSKDKELRDKILELLGKISASTKNNAVIPSDESEIDRNKRKASEEANKDAADAASLELLKLLNGEFQKDKPTEEFKQLFGHCFENKKSSKDVGYDQKLKILKARETLELAGEYGVDTGYPPCYGEELLYLDLLKNLNINSDSKLAKQLGIPEFDHSTGQAAKYDKKLLDDLILLDHLKENNQEKYDNLVQLGMSESGSLKSYLVKNNLIEEGMVSSRDVEVKKRVVAIQKCLEKIDSKDNSIKNKTDDEIYQECLKDTHRQIDSEYEEVKDKYDDRVVAAADKIDKRIFDMKLTPTTSVKRIDTQTLSVTQLVNDARRFGK